MVEGGHELQGHGGAQVRRELELYWSDHVILNPPMHRRVMWERSNQAALRGALADFTPDVVSVWAMGAMSFGLLTTVAENHIPTVLVIWDEWPVYGPSVDAWARPFRSRPVAGRVARALTRLPTSLPDLDSIGPACFASAFLRDAVRDRSPWRFPAASVVHLGIDQKGFPLTEASDREWRWRLLYVGRIDSRKGIDTVIRALPLCPADATLVVCGTGDDSYRVELERLGDALGVGDRVRFTSAPRSELAGRYAAADVVVFPSIWEEPFGLVPLEAMSCGTPLVATAVGGAAEFLDDGENCLTFTPGDPEVLAAMLSRLAGDPELRARIVAGGTRTADAFGVDELADALEAVHASVGRQPPSQVADRQPG